MAITPKRMAGLAKELNEFNYPGGWYDDPTCSHNQYNFSFNRHFHHNIFEMHFAFRIVPRKATC
jgi:hypothetical protein